MQDYRKLEVWKKSHLLALDVYKATRSFPHDELFGLTSQIRRCSVSVPSNIVEGCGRASNADLSRFLHIALGSANELEYQLLLVRDLGFISEDVHTALAERALEVKRMLAALIVKLKVPTRSRVSP